MPKLYDNSGKPVFGITPQQAREGIAAGKYGYVKGEEITMRDADGNPFSVKAEEVPAAIRDNWTIETPVQAGVREYLKENEGIKGAAKVAIGQFLDEALFGIPELVFDKTADPFELAKKEALKNQHQIANAIGGVGGFAASMFYGGELMKPVVGAGRAVEAGILGTRAGESLAVHSAERAAAEGIGAGAAGGAESALARAGETSLPRAGEALQGAASVPEAAIGAVARKPTIAESIVSRIGPPQPAPAIEAAKVAESMPAAGADFMSAIRAADGSRVAEEAIKAAAKEAAEKASEATLQSLTQNLINKGMSEATANTVAPGLLRKILASSVRMGFEGGVMSAPQAITEAMLGDPDQAAESLLFGVGAGAVLGTVGAAGKAALGAGAKAMTRLSDEAAAKSIDPLKKYATDIKKIGYDKFGKILYTNGWMRKVGEEIPEYADRLKIERNKVGSDISNLYTNLDKMGADTGLKAENLVHDFKVKVLAPLETLPFYDKIQAEIGRNIESFEKTAGLTELSPTATMTFEQLHKYRAALDDTLYRTSKLFPNEAEKELKKIRDVMTESLEKRGEEVARRNNASFLPELTDLNQKYGVLSTAYKASADNEVREITNRRISLTDYISGNAAASLFSGNLGVGAIFTLLSSVGNKFVRKNGNILLAHAGNQFGTLFAESAMKNAAHQFDRIPEVLTAMATRTKMYIKEDDEVHAMSQFMGDMKANKSAHEQFKELSTKLSNLVSDSYEFTTGSMKLSNAIADHGAPAIGAAYMQKQQSAIQHLYQTMPKPILPPQPFQKDNWQPTKKEIAEWSKRVAIVNNPFIVFKKLENGTLTKPEVETMKAVWPKFHQKLVLGIQTEAYKENVKPLPYDKRLKLSLLTGAQLDYSIQPQTIKVLQGSFDSKKESHGSKKALDHMPSLATDTMNIGNTLKR